MAKNNVFRRRLPVFVRDDWRCQFCGKDLLADEYSLRQLTVDHILPTTLGGKNEPDNMITCCFLCNQAKGGWVVAALDDARRLIRERRRVIFNNLIEELQAAGQPFPRGKQRHTVQSIIVTVDPSAVSANVTFEQQHHGEPAVVMVQDSLEVELPQSSFPLQTTFLEEVNGGAAVC